MTPSTEPAAHSMPQDPPDIEIPEPYGKPRPGPHPLTQPRVYLPLLFALFVLNIPFLHLWLRGPPKTTTTIPFSDNFNRTDLGPNYYSTGGFWRIMNGWLYAPGVKNNPLWLQAKLPHDVVIEFDARAENAAGDIKCEIFGNGRDHASGYVILFGGWHNSVSAIARLDEHGLDRHDRRDLHAVVGQTYHFKIVRKGSLLTWYLDGNEVLHWDDAAPLYGPENDRFGFGAWTTDVYYDNLSIKPLN